MIKTIHPFLFQWTSKPTKTLRLPSDSMRPTAMFSNLKYRSVYRHGPARESCWLKLVEHLSHSIRHSPFLYNLQTIRCSILHLSTIGDLIISISAHEMRFHNVKILL